MGQEETRKKILEAAREVFREYGPAHGTLKDVAVRAGVSKALVYYYFHDKEELFREVVVSMDAAFLAMLKEQVERIEDPSERLLAYFTQRFEFLHQAVARRRVSLERAAEYLPVFQSAHETFVRGEAALIQEILEYGIRKGRFHIEDPGAVARELASVVLALDHITFIHGHPVIHEEHWKMVIGILIRGLEC